MMDGMKNSAPRVMDPMGRLLFEGQEVATYLFQVPDDVPQWHRLQEIVTAILHESGRSPRVELPQIAKEMELLLQDPPSVMVADQLVAGFDRMVKLWKSAKSGLLDASRLSSLGMESPLRPPE
jgi:hypothetical protein